MNWLKKLLALLRPTHAPRFSLTYHNGGTAVLTLGQPLPKGATLTIHRLGGDTPQSLVLFTYARPERSHSDCQFIAVNV